MRIFTIGHSTRTIEDFLALLREFGVEALADVRAFPGSRHNPQFGREALEASLRAAGIEYHWLGRELGGHRKASEGLGDASPNMGWATEGFRLYADYMRTPSFHEGLRRLMELARRLPTAYMCAEKIYFRCHRRLISDALTAAGFEVVHIVDPGRSLPHEMTPFARLGPNGTLEYPPPDEPGPLFGG